MSSSNIFTWTDHRDDLNTNEIIQSFCLSLLSPQTSFNHEIETNTTLGEKSAMDKIIIALLSSDRGQHCRSDLWFDLFTQDRCVVFWDNLIIFFL